jgi:DNA-binding NarL/FixJ family response regulator
VSAGWHLDGLRFRLVEEFVSLVERLALVGPLVLALEDLHWADSSTLLTVHHIGRRLTHLPVVVLATFRPSPRWPDLDRVMADLVDRGGRHLVLGPLDDDAVVLLVHRVAQAPPTPRLVAVVRGAGGNPLFVQELLVTLRAGNALQIIDGRADVDVPVTPSSFRALVLRQLSTLPDPARRVLRMAAVLGPSFSLAELAIVLQRPASAVLDDLDEAFRAGILGTIPDGLTFRHELVREAVYLDLPESVRRDLHLQAGRALVAGGASAIRVAPHLVRGARAGDRGAVDWLSRAAQQVVPQAPAAAVDLFEHALRIAVGDDELRYALTAQLVDALFLSGRFADAQARARQLLAVDGDVGHRNAVRLAVMRAMLTAGRVGDARAEIEAAIREFSGDDSDRLRLDINNAFALAFTGDVPRGLALAEEALAVADRLHDEEIRQYACSVICITATFIGETGRAVAAGRHAVDRGGPGASPAHRYGAHLFYATALMEADQMDEADLVLRTGQRIADEAGMPWQSSYYLGQTGLHHFDTGRWDDAVAELEASSLLFYDNMGARSTFAEAMLAVIHLYRGMLDRASAHVAQAQQALAAGHRVGMDIAIWAAALLQEARGDGGGALTTLASAWQLNQLKGCRSDNARFGLDLVRLASGHGQDTLARTVAEEMTQLATLNPTASRRGLAEACRGLVEADPGPLRAAVQTYRDSPRVVERLACALAAGLAAGRAGQREEATALLIQAATAGRELGAERVVARAEAAMRALGVRPPRRAVRHRPTRGWDSLTPTELKVIRLAQHGLTNAQIGERLFISGRTVETHFSHVFAKLDVSSRVQVVAEAARRLDPDT